MMGVWGSDRHRRHPKWTSAPAYKEFDLPCDECAELHTHRFRSLISTGHAPFKRVFTSFRICGSQEYAALPGHSVVLVALGEIPASR